MSRGLPNFRDTLTRPSGNRGSETRDLSPPNNLKKIKIESLDIPFRSEVTELLLNPSSISETKSANWVQQQTPGQSDPIMQWMNGSERVVTFTALVTKDQANNPTLTQNTITERVSIIEADDATAGLEVVDPVNSTEARILGGLSQQELRFGIPGQILSQESQVTNTTTTWLTSIQTNLDYYRSLLAPRKSNRRFQVKAPPLIRLHIGDILGNKRSVERQRWIMLAYDFNITKFTPDLKPIEAEVQFTFVEYVDRSKTLDSDSINRQLDADSAKSADITNTVTTSIPRDAIDQSLDRF